MIPVIPSLTVHRLHQIILACVTQDIMIFRMTQFAEFAIKPVRIVQVEIPPITVQLVTTVPNSET